MATESIKLLESNGVPGSGESYSTDGLSGVQDNKHLGLLNDFDSYWEEINDRLIISRVVNDSLVKAVLEEAAETVAVKEFQVIGLKEKLFEQQMLQQLQEELELVVMQNTFHNFKEGSEKTLQGSQCNCSKRIRCRDNLKQVLSICKDLEAVQKSLSNLEPLSTHGSLDSDYFTRRVSSNKGLPSSTLWERKGSKEESNVNLPENFESSGLKNKLPAELYSHFREMIIKIKRDHETNVQAMTEDYFRLKGEFLKGRELLKERGLFLPHKSKDCDQLRKKIPDVISKLNDIFLENEDFADMCDLSKDQYNSLLMENHDLRDILNDEGREVKFLSSQVSEAEEKLRQKVLGEKCLFKQIKDLETSLDGAIVEASLSEEVYMCTIRDLAFQKCEEEENKMKAIIMQETLELVYRESLHEFEAKMSSEYGGFSNMQTTTIQVISGAIYGEVLKDMEMQLKNLKEKYLEMDEHNASLKSKASDMEKVLASMGEEKHDLDQKILELETLLEEKAKLQITEKDHFAKEMTKMMDHMEKQEVKLEQSLQQVNLYKNHVDKLTETLVKADLESRTTILQERQNASLLIGMKDREYKEQMISVIYALQELAKTFEGFEIKAAHSIKSKQLRLKDSKLQIDSLITNAKLLRSAKVLCENKLQIRCSDLQKAEAEVDLLGDEVEILLGLLEKIYIALDHYSPVLQHYPGIMEILKLVQRELNVASTKSGSRTP